MPEQPLEDFIDRLERERQLADRAYNDALTALDRAIQSPAALPGPPPAVAGDPVPSGLQDSTKARRGLLRSIIWRVIGPPLDLPPGLTRTLVLRANQSLETERALRETLAALLESTRRELGALVAFESRLIAYLQTVTAYIDTKDRRFGVGDLRDRVALAEQRLALLKREVEKGAVSSVGTVDAALESAAPSSSGGAVASATYVGFEDRFRGPQAEIRRRVEDYAPLFAGATNVVDIGCGRGELVDLLGSCGIAARGVDSNAAMVELCRARGLNVESGDALGFLMRQPDASIGGLAAIQVVEHFEPTYLARFLEAAYLKMTPNAVLVLETINPGCWMAFFETYIRDLTHQRPLHADTLRYLVEASGFTNVDVQYRSPVTEGDRLDRVASPAIPASDTASQALNELAATVNAHADKLNARLFSTMDYVVVARR